MSEKITLHGKTPAKAMGKKSRESTDNLKSGSRGLHFPGIYYVITLLQG